MAGPAMQVIVRPGYGQTTKERQLQCEEILGSGSFGVVYRVMDRQTKQQFALKVMELATEAESDRGRMLDEVSLLAKVRHPNIVSFEDAWQESEKLFLLMELCPGTDLQRFLEDRADPEALLSETTLLHWLQQIARGLQYLHSGAEGRPVILHRDVKPKNILVTEARESTLLKLSDFGVAKEVGHQSSMALSVVGSPCILSPEMITSAQHGYTCKTDIWSFGCCAYYISTLKQLFDTQNLVHLVQGIKAYMNPQINADYSENTKELIKSMLNVDASKRPTADEILQEIHQILHAESGWEAVPSYTEPGGSPDQSHGGEPLSFIVHASRSQPPLPVPQASTLTDYSVISGVSDAPPRTPADEQRDLRTCLRLLSQEARENPEVKEKIHRMNTATDPEKKEMHGVNSATTLSVRGTMETPVYSSPQSSLNQPSFSVERGESAVTEEWIWEEIIEYQKTLTGLMGEEKFKETYECLQIQDDNKLMKLLHKKLGAEFSSLVPYFLALKFYENLLPENSTT